MVMLLGIMDETMCHMESLRGILRDLPLLYAPITPVLSPWTIIWQSLNPWVTIQNSMLEGNGFGPAYIPSISFPARREHPHSPLLSYAHSNAPVSGCINPDIRI